MRARQLCDERLLSKEGYMRDPSHRDTSEREGEL